MSFTIAVAGKGGSGKTTLAGLIIRNLLNRDSGAVLAVDADPNSNLHETIGMEVERTVGSTLAEFFKERMQMPPGMTKEVYLEIKLNEIIAEGKGVDLLSMGRGEGKGCYCYPNLMVKKFVDTLSENYGYVVMDNQAGMEHMSRRTTDDIDLLLVVASPTVKGVRAAARIFALIEELELRTKKAGLVMNMSSDPLDETLAEELSRESLEPMWIVPADPLIQKYDLDRRPLTEMPDDSPAVSAVNALLQQELP